jgi:hypothetical protein
MMGRKYQKNDTDMYDYLKDRQTDAIRNAKKLLASYNRGCNPERDDPSTKVHLLVERLNEFIGAKDK